MVGLAGYAFLAVIEGICARAVGACSDLEVVDLSLGAREAKFLDEVKVVGHEAGNAGVIVPEIIVLAFACVLGVAEGLSERASLTVMRSSIVKRRSRASGATISVEKGRIRRTIHAYLGSFIIDLFVIAEEALILAEVEVFRRVAIDAVGSVPVKASWALAGLIKHDHSALASLAVTTGRVPHRAIGTNSAFRAVKIRSILRTVNTLFLDNAVDLIMRA